MADEKDTKVNTEEKVEKKAQEANTDTTSPKKDHRNQGFRGGQGQGNREFKKNRRQPRRRPDRKKSEFDQKLLDIRRVTRVAAGGRRFSFSVAMVAGDRRGRVGVGIGKASDTALAIEKAFKSAKKNLITIPTTKEMSIPHDVKAKYCSSIVMLMPAPGRGVIAGSSVRDVIELAGLKDINAKIISGSKNKMNNAQAAVKALSLLKGKPEKPSKEEKRDNKPAAKTDKAEKSKK